MRDREELDGLVWLLHERTYGYIVGAMGTYYTTIWYLLGGIEYEVLMENEDFELVEDLIVDE